MTTIKPDDRGVSAPLSPQAKWTRAKVRKTLEAYHELERAAENAMAEHDRIWGSTPDDVAAIQNPAPFYERVWPRSDPRWPDYIRFVDWSGEDHNSSVPWEALWKPEWFEAEKERAKAMRESAAGRAREEADRKEYERLKALFVEAE